MMSPNPHIGSSFYDFLREGGRFDEAILQAKKRVIAWQIEDRRRAQKFTKTAMAQRMGTSRTEIARVLNPASDKAHVDTLVRADAIGTQPGREAPCRS